MNKKDKDLIIARYRERLMSHGQNISALASGTEDRRKIRFGVLAQVGDLNGASVLDLGCGFGDFYAHLKSSGIQVKYTGYDIVPEFIELARTRFPDEKFEVRDIQTNPIEDKFDYVVSSQTFNNKLKNENNLDVMKDMLRQCYKAAQKGVVIDMLTSYVDFHEDHLFYYSPEEIFTFSKSLTKRVSIRHDYPLFEFAVYLYKDFQGWKK